MSNHTHQPNEGYQIKRERQQTVPSDLNRLEIVVDNNCYHVVQIAVFDIDKGNHRNGNNLQYITDQRNDSAVRTLAFRYARFFVYVEYADFTAGKSADKVYEKGKARHNIRNRRYNRGRVAHHIDQNMVDCNTRNRTGENFPQRFHRINICI